MLKTEKSPVIIRPKIKKLSISRSSNRSPIIEKITAKKAILKRVPQRPGDQLKTAATIDKAKQLLGYTPSTRFEDGLKAQVAWYRSKFCQ